MLSSCNGSIGANSAFETASGADGSLDAGPDAAPKGPTAPWPTGYGMAGHYASALHDRWFYSWSPSIRAGTDYERFVPMIWKGPGKDCEDENATCTSWL